MCGSHVSGSGAIPDAPQWGEPGQSEWNEDLLRSTYTMPVEKQHSRGSLRKDGPSPGSVAEDPAEAAALHVGVRAAPHGHHGPWAPGAVRWPLRQNDRSAWVVSWDAQNGLIHRSTTYCGHLCLSFGTHIGHDMTSQIYLRNILSHIKQDRVLGRVMTPSLKRPAAWKPYARNLPQLLRSLDYADLSWIIIAPRNLWLWGDPRFKAMNVDGSWRDGTLHAWQYQSRCNYEFRCFLRQHI